MEEVVQENFTRYADDESMNKYLKDQIIDDDPMAQYFLTKQQKIEIKTGTGTLIFLFIWFYYFFCDNFKNQ